MQISQFEYKDTTLEITYQNGHLAWAFELDGKNYGARTKVNGKKTIDVASTAANLLLNAIATYEDLRLSQGA